jgi:FkbM family methyltransferase
MTSGVMERFVHPLLRIGKFVHRLGLIQGGVAYGRVARNERLEHSPHLYAVRVRGYPEPLWLRAGHSDCLIFGQVIIDLQYNLPDVDEVRLIVDCGANIGVSALYFARRYPAAKILAIEPDPDNYAMLVRNTRQAASIHPLQAAVWPRQASLSIVDPTRPAAALRVSEGPGKGPGSIRSLQLRDVVAEHGKIDILKIDIEGSEKALFEDPACAEWLTHTRVIYAELHDWMEPGSSRAFYQAITRFSFSQQHMGEIVAVELHHPAS